MRNNRYWVLISLFFLGLGWSAVNPKDYFTWILEVFPAIIGLAVLVFTFRKFRFTDMTYLFILLHCFVLFVGGHYTYAEVPLFSWIRDALHEQRNNYDKVGHFMQGFVPAMIARELFLRKEIVRKGAWVSVLTVSVCMGISMLYEFLEWFVAISSGQSAEAFLGTQGDPWDTQSDMLMATIGAIVMVTLVAGIHDRQIVGMKPAVPPSSSTIR